MRFRILTFATIIILSNLIICSLWALTPAAYGMNESAYPAKNNGSFTQPVLERSEGFEDKLLRLTAVGTSRQRRGATIALHKEVTISDRVVTIEAIADIQSEDKAFGEQLSKIEIERAPVV